MMCFEGGRRAHDICNGNHDRRAACEREFDSSESAEHDELWYICCALRSFDDSLGVRGWDE
jgi:hypothetical protein